MANVPARPAHPERICWGCDRRCPSGDLICGEEKARAPHPVELFGDRWIELDADRRNGLDPLEGIP